MCLDSEKCSEQGEIRRNKYQFLLLDFFFLILSLLCYVISGEV